jgi:hypothetical protein
LRRVWRAVSIAFARVSPGDRRFGPSRGFQRNVNRHGTVPSRDVIKIGNVDRKILIDELVPERDAERFQTRAGLVIGPNAIGPDQKNQVRNGRRSVGSLG